MIHVHKQLLPRSIADAGIAPNGVLCASTSFRFCFKAVCVRVSTADGHQDSDVVRLASRVDHVKRLRANAMQTQARSKSITGVYVLAHASTSSGMQNANMQWYTCTRTHSHTYWRSRGSPPWQQPWSRARANTQSGLRTNKHLMRCRVTLEQGVCHQRV